MQKPYGEWCNVIKKEHEIHNPALSSLECGMCMVTFHDPGTSSLKEEWVRSRNFVLKLVERDQLQLEHEQ